ncbi:MAG: DUF4430 domain-containing protein [Thermoleophilia bacterium]
MRITLRASLAAACAAGLVAAPAALPLDTTIRVEGSSANLIPESAIPIEGDGTATVFDSQFQSVDVSRASAFWQLYRATAATGLGLSFTYFPAFTSVLVDKVGTDANAGTAGWQFRVDHVGAGVGADATPLKQGDSVLWYYGAADGARELDVAPSADRVGSGTSFTVKVTSYGADGAAAPGTGAVVRYGQASATAGADGQVSFIAQGAGTQTVSATRAGDIRSAARGVCAFAGDPSVCNLPAQAAPPGGAAATGDTVAPGSRITFPRLGGRAAAVRGISGVAGPDRSDVAGVEVALARRVGTQCRFRTRSGSLTAPRSCTARLYLKARSSGGNWTLPLRKGLAPGAWRVWVRATDGAGNVEKVGIARVNSGTFTVGKATR